MHKNTPEVSPVNLEGRGSSGKFEPHFHEENGSEQENKFGRVIYASKTIQNCKNPTVHIDTLIDSVLCSLQDDVNIKGHICK